MDNNTYFNGKEESIPQNEIKLQSKGFRRGLDNSEDLFVDVSPLPSIMGSIFILNNNYKGK